LKGQVSEKKSKERVGKKKDLNKSRKKTSLMVYFVTVGF
jgi:hypothetical protein